MLKNHFGWDSDNDVLLNNLPIKIYITNLGILFFSLAQDSESDDYSLSNHFLCLTMQSEIKLQNKVSKANNLKPCDMFTILVVIESILHSLVYHCLISGSR